MEILHRAEELCPGHGNLDCSILGRMLSVVFLAQFFMSVCLLRREHFPWRLIPNLIASQAMRSLRVYEDKWLQGPLGDFRMACQPRWGCPGLPPSWFHPATVGGGVLVLIIS